LEVELLGEFLVLDDVVFAEGEDDGEVVSALFINYVDVVDGVQQLLVVLPHVLLDHP
jgi:hypothetical protein